MLCQLTVVILIANDFMWQSILFQAVIEDCVEVVHVLVENDATLNIKDADLWTPLHAAVACGNCDLVKYLVEHGADMVAINADGNMPIDLVDENEEIEVYLDKMMTEEGIESFTTYNTYIFSYVLRRVWVMFRALVINECFYDKYTYVDYELDIWNSGQEELFLDKYDHDCNENV